MILVEELVRMYGEVAAVSGVSFEIAPGEVVGFLGPNGAGKTTTLKVLAGFLHPTSGRVSVAGFDASDGSLESRRRVGYLPENNPLYEEMEVTEYLEWTAAVRGVPARERERAVKTVVGRCGLADAAGKPVGALSKGYRQRVGLAAAMVHDPPILLLDEPTSGLDPNQAAEVRDLIGELRREKTVLLCTHILSEARASCDRVIIIHRGRIAAQGRPEELAAGHATEQVLHLVLSGSPDRAAVERELKRLPGARSVEARGLAGETAFALTADPPAEGGADLRARLFALAVEKRWPVVELRREGLSLEEIFRSLTA